LSYANTFSSCGARRQDNKKRLREAEKQLEQLPRAEVEKRHSVRAVMFLHQKPHEEFAKFINALDENQESMVAFLIRATSLSDLINQIGGSIRVEPNPEKFKQIWKGPDDNLLPDLRFISWGITGSLAVLVGRHIVMDPRKFEHFDSEVKRLHEYMQS
jgi:hypothetical protein